MTSPRRNPLPKSGSELAKERRHAAADERSSKRHDDGHASRRRAAGANTRAARPRSGRSGSDSNAATKARGH
jgi:hypothetical protein